MSQVVVLLGAFSAAAISLLALAYIYVMYVSSLRELTERITLEETGLLAALGRTKV